MKRAALLALSLAAGLAACGGGGDGGAPNHALSGKVGGMDWTLLAGETKAVLSKDDTYWADLYDVAIEDPCFGQASPSGATREIILTVPKSLGHHPLGFSLTQTFYVDNAATGGDNFAATSGFVDVAELTTTMIRGSASFAYNTANSVSGTFEIAICP